jgi:FkbM family methyltransferase
VNLKGKNRQSLTAIHQRHHEEREGVACAPVGNLGPRARTHLDQRVGNRGLRICVNSANKAMRIHAFEPYPPVLKIIRRNLAINSLEQDIEVFEEALSSEPGQADLYVPIQDHGLVESSCSLDADFKGVHSSIVKVPVTTLDDHISCHKISDLCMLKIDVEGHESKVLSGSLKSLQDQQPVVFFEVLPQADGAVINAIRERLDYISYRMHEDCLIEEDIIAFDPNGWNHCMVPSKLRGFLEDRAKSLGLGVQCL